MARDAVVRPQRAWLTVRVVLLLSICWPAQGFVAWRKTPRSPTERHVSGSTLPPAWLQAIQESEVVRESRAATIEKREDLLLLSPQQETSSATSGVGSPQQAPTFDGANLIVAQEPGRTVRLACLSDLSPLAEHRLKIFRNIVPSSSPSRTYNAIHDNLVASMRRRYYRTGTYILLVTRDDDALAPVRRETLLGNLELSSHVLEGFSKVNPEKFINTWYLTEMAVASAYRRTGVARDLLRCSEVLATKTGVQELLLHVEVDNVGAVELYRKAGFEILPQTPKALSFTGQMGLLDPVYAMKRYHLMWKKVDSQECI